MTGESPVLIDGIVAQNMSNTLEQILDVLRGSTIAGERGGDVESKFWATYKKVSDEYDNDFLERANDDMAIILIFAGLFSAVNTTFIVGLQPNPADTTNVLMVQMINIMVNGPDTVNTSNLSSSTTYVSSIIWMQTLLYASLAFSLLAAFGAVLGKQWLNSYKAARGRGTLKERGEQRQKKFDGIEYWQLQAILKAFLVLLQMSLFLFALSLSANMWIQQATISIVIISTTAFGMLFYLTTIFVSVFYPDSPFQTAESALIIALCNNFFAGLRKQFAKLSNTPSDTPLFTLYILVDKLFDTLFHTAFITRLTDDPFINTSAIRWLLEASTNPDVVEPAAGIIPFAQWPQDYDASAIFRRLRDTVITYRDRHELFMKCGKALAHFCIQPAKIEPDLLLHKPGMRYLQGKGHFIRDAFISGRDAWDKLKMAKTDFDCWKLSADVRAAVSTIVVHGSRDHLSRPDDESPLQDCDFQWRHYDGQTPSYGEFDWLVDYLMDKLDNATNDERAQGDALLALSAMNGLGSDAKRVSYINALIHCMDPTRPSRVRCAAVKAISDAQEELSSMVGDSMPRGVDVQLLDKLFSCLSTAVSSSYDSAADFHSLNFYYSRLIFSLIKSDEWWQRLTQNGHVQQCIHLFPTFPESTLYIAGICRRIDPTGNGPSLSYIQGKWGVFLASAWSRSWSSLARKSTDFHDCLEILPALVTMTKQYLSNPDDGVANLELVSRIAAYVDRVSAELQKRDGIDGGVLSAVQSLLTI